MQNKLLLFLLLFSFALFFAYQNFFSKRIYETSVELIVKNTSDESSSFNGALNFFGGLPSSGQNDIHIISSYIKSYNMLKHISHKADLEMHYKDYEFDIFRRLPSNASKEAYFDRYLRYVHTKIDSESNILKLIVRAYTPQMAFDVSDIIVSECEAFINKISEDIANDQVEFVAKELRLAEERLKVVRQNLLEFQDSQKLINPELTTEAAVGMIVGLEEQLIHLKAEGIRLRSFIKEGSPEIVSNNQRVLSLEKQLMHEKSRLTGSGTDKLNRSLALFNDLQLEAEFALESYKAGFSSLEKARLDASRKLKHLVKISSTGLPEDPAYPRVLYNLLTASLVLLLIYGVIRLVIATIQDHRL